MVFLTVLSIFLDYEYVQSFASNFPTPNLNTVLGQLHFNIQVGSTCAGRCHSWNLNWNPVHPPKNIQVPKADALGARNQGQ